MVDEPRRLLDDPTVPEDLRRALEQASSVAPPLAAGGLARLEQAMQGGGAGAGGGLGGSGAVGAAVGVVAVLATIGGWMAWSDAGERDPTAETAPDGASTTEPDALPDPATVIAPTIAEDDGTATDTTLDTTAAHGDGTVTDVATPTAAGPSTERAARAEPSRADDSLAREMSALAAARTALDHDPARALALLERGRREHGASSLFAEEREALSVLALCALDRDDEASRRGARFLAAHPSSPFADRVRRATDAGR